MSQLSMKDRIKQEAATGGFRRHREGTFPAKIESINERSWDGQPLWELTVVTDEGSARVTIWKNSHTSIKTTEDEDRYIKGMGRMLRLYTDLGLTEPDGAGETELEEAVYGRLGELIGRDCTLVVQKDKRKPGEVVCFINAPRGASVPANGAASAFDGQPLPAGDVPF